MAKIYSYILRFDDGAAPNPFWGYCTLTICKPVIRRNAQIGDWVIGTGSKKAQVEKGEIHNFSDRVVYAMKITDKKTMKEYDTFCTDNLPNKIPVPSPKDWKLKLGDCIYDYSNQGNPTPRDGAIHQNANLAHDLSGLNALLSDHFYYFGAEARPLPDSLRELIKRNQGHKKIEKTELIEEFEQWIAQFEKNKLYAEPQLQWQFKEKMTAEQLSACAKARYDDDQEENEETVS
jgi:hypothetical protein